MGAVALQCHPDAIQAMNQCSDSCVTPCEAKLHWKEDGQLEIVDAKQGDGDVKDSQAMINHQLLKASRDGDTEAMATAVKRGAYLETRRPFVMTPESAVAQSDYAQVRHTRGTGLTPLMYSAQGGYDKAVELLIEAKACINAEDEDGMTPLHFAASSGSMDCCRILIKGGAEVAAMDDEGRKPVEHVPASYVITAGERKAWDQLFKEPEEAKQLECELGAE